MSLLSRWLGRALDRFATTSSLAQTTKQRFLHELRQQARYADPGRLARFEQQVFSQSGEDGAIREIFRRIGTTNREFVELGVGNGLENNTAFLLYQGWGGVWLEGGAKNCKKIRAGFHKEMADGRLKLIEGLITAENVAALLHGQIQSPEMDLLSVDVDRNTWHVWKALAALRPRVVVVEYNALFPADMAWVVDYDAASWWDGSSYFGASLKTFEQLATTIGYHLVGCDITGTNAYFVRGDLCGSFFCAPFTAENHYEPPRYYLHTRVGHPRAFRD